MLWTIPLKLLGCFFPPYFSYLEYLGEKIVESFDVMFKAPQSFLLKIIFIKLATYVQGEYSLLGRSSIYLFLLACKQFIELRLPGIAAIKS